MKPTITTYSASPSAPATKAASPAGSEQPSADGIENQWSDDGRQTRPSMDNGRAAVKQGNAMKQGSAMKQRPAMKQGIAMKGSLEE